MTPNRKEANPVEPAICEAVIAPQVEGHWRKAVSRISKVTRAVQ